MLYPLKFNPIYKEKIWGGQKLKTVLQKNIPEGKIGESWEISAVEDNLSVVENGIYAGNSLQDMIELYMGDLVGDVVYERFGIEFPLLIKFIDASADLSVQVHPDDKTAKERHNAYGKTEMWYVIQADKGAELISGFNQDISKNEFVNRLKNNNIKDVLQYVPAQKGDVFYIPPGRVHTIGKHILLAEIQQTSDITYRIYDWDRTDEYGNKRDLHIEEALDVLDFKQNLKPKIEYAPDDDRTLLLKTDYFTVNRLKITSRQIKDYHTLDSFVVLMCLSGDLIVEFVNGAVNIRTGETVLIPAEFEELEFNPNQKTELLEVYIEL